MPNKCLLPKSNKASFIQFYIFGGRKPLINLKQHDNYVFYFIYFSVTALKQLAEGWKIIYLFVNNLFITLLLRCQIRVLYLHS